MSTRYHRVAQSSALDKLRLWKPWRALIPDKRTTAILRSPLTIAQLDGLFTLPSLSSIVSHPRLLLFFEVPFLVIIILALPLIAIFGPAAMVTSLSKPTTTNVSVPTIDLQHMRGGGIVSGIALLFPSAVADVIPEANWMRSAQTAMEALTPLSWSTPPPTGCSARCNYTMAYAAPALACQDLRIEQIWNPKLWSSDMPPPETLITLDQTSVYNASIVNGTMTLAWTPSNSDLLRGSPQGVTCAFVNATYRASISYSNGSQSLWTEIISTGQRYGTDIQMDPDTTSGLEITATMQIVAFVAAFASSFDKTLGLGFASDLEAQAPPLFVINSTTFSLRSDVSNLNHGLTSLVGNVTLSLMAYSNTTALVKLESQSDRPLYDLRAFTLVLTYGVAFSLSGVAVALGLRALMSNRTFRPVSFSQFLLTTRNPEMDRWMGAGSRLAGPTLTDEEMATRMTFDGTSFRPVWARKEKGENDDGEERNDERDSFHPDVGSPYGALRIYDHAHQGSDRVQESMTTERNEGAKAEDDTPTKAVNLALHSTRSEP